MNIKRIASLAWKNIWRNRVRSGVILGAIALGLFAGTYLSALMTGWMIGTINSDINNFMSHVQIHDSTFIANSDINAYFLKTPVAERLAQSGIEAQTAYRLKLNGMLASAGNVTGIVVKGVFRDQEMQTTTLWKQIPDSLGSFFPDNFRIPIVISAKTAEKLKVRLRSKIVFTFQDVSGNMQSLAFRVCGIFRTTNGMLDESMAFVLYDDIFPATGLPQDAVHEAGILFRDLKASETLAPQVKALFPDMRVEDWREMNPMLSMSLEWINMMAVVIIGIFLLALSFGIVNTMLMAVLERTRELGMLGAIGMSKKSIFSMIMLETVFLTFVGSVVGIILGVALLLPSIHTGLDLTPLMGDTFVDWGFGSVIYPQINVAMFVEIVILVIVAGILSAIYPAMKALKLKPLEAIRQL